MARSTGQQESGLEGESRHLGSRSPCAHPDADHIMHIQITSSTSGYVRRTGSAAATSTGRVQSSHADAPRPRSEGPDGRRGVAQWNVFQRWLLPSRGLGGAGPVSVSRRGRRILPRAAVRDQRGHRAAHRASGSRTGAPTSPSGRGDALLPARSCQLR